MRASSLAMIQQMDSFEEVYNCRKFIDSSTESWLSSHSVTIQIWAVIALVIRGICLFLSELEDGINIC